jgi:hypothetical protein
VGVEFPYVMSYWHCKNVDETFLEPKCMMGVGPNGVPIQAHPRSYPSRQVGKESKDYEVTVPCTARSRAPFD